MDNVINFQDAKDGKLKKTVPKPIDMTDSIISAYLSYRSGLVEQIEKTWKILIEFENTELVLYSKDCKVSRPKLDMYMTTKMSFLTATQLMAQVDANMKQKFPSMISPDTDIYSF